MWLRRENQQFVDIYLAPGRFRYVGIAILTTPKDSKSRANSKHQRYSSFGDRRTPVKFSGTGSSIFSRSFYPLKRQM